MVLLLMADSQFERVWANVRNNREGYRTGVFIPVKNLGQLVAGVQGMTASVSLIILSRGIWFGYYWRLSHNLDTLQPFCNCELQCRLLTLYLCGRPFKQ